ncbi:MAG: hypothetical protein J1E38_07105 [Paramuribaculum sp.]|nr:hypothetical protein [Paramuribaculum sp.]
MRTIIKSILFISILLTLAVTTFPIDARPQSQDEEEKHSAYIALMDSADRACADENWRKAERFLIEALRLEPANPSNILLISNLGMVRFYDGRDSMAIATLNDAVEMAPNSTVVLQNRAKVLSAIGRHDEAYRDRGKIAELDSTNIGNLYLHAVAAIIRNDTVAIARDLRLMEAADPADIRIIKIRAQLLTSNGNYREALSPLNKIIESDPASEFFSMRALCNLMIGRLDEASEDISEGLLLDPTDGELYLYRALLNKFRYRDEESQKDARLAVELGIDPARAAPLLPKK